jgi:hypothetical protein
MASFCKTGRELTAMFFGSTDNLTAVALHDEQQAHELLR